MSNESLNAFVRENINYAALLDQLTEELGEMQHHVIKAARAYREENPTPADWKDELNKACYELGDVVNCINLLNLKTDFDYMNKKMERWKQRIIEAREAAEQ